MPIPVDASGCSGGACGIQTTITPNYGPTGTQVAVSISSGGLPIGGKYELYWSKSPLMDSNDVTVTKLAEGKHDPLQQSATMSVSIPETVNGIGYLHFIRAGRGEQMMNFSFTVTPSLNLETGIIHQSGQSCIRLRGTGFTPLDNISFQVDGVPCEQTATSSELGSFSCDLPLPQLTAGAHIIKATAAKMYNQEAAATLKSQAKLVLEPAIPLAGSTATVTGSGFAPGSEVSIKWDDILVTASPVSDSSGYFTYNFTVPDSNQSSHTLTASDTKGNITTFSVSAESNPPTTPTPILPGASRYGVMGAQPVTFNWMPSQDESGQVTYIVEISDNLNFFPLAPGMRNTGINDTCLTLNLQPGTYYWRVQAVDMAGNKSKWALSPYAFQVGLINVWLVAGASLILLVIFVFLLRAFIQRIRGYYY